MAGLPAFRSRHGGSLALTARAPLHLLVVSRPHRLRPAELSRQGFPALESASLSLNACASGWLPVLSASDNARRSARSSSAKRPACACMAAGVSRQAGLVLRESSTARVAGFDRTHVVKINWQWNLPRSPWANPVAQAILSNWQLSGITTFQSGSPLGVSFSTTTSMDITGTPSQGARVDIVGNPVLPKSQRTFACNFATEMVRLPAKGTVGNSAGTIIRGPGINNCDAALFKNVPIWESLRLQLRWEACNVFNHKQFSAFNTAARFDPAGNQINTQLGQFTAARSPRRMQLAVWLYF
jgi:hypothetical protein